MAARPVSAHEETALAFLTALATLSGGCAPTERFIMQVLPGDPGDAKDYTWRPRAWRPGDLLPASPERTNGYVAISTFGRAPDGSWRRQKALFAQARMIMVDDVGTKVDPANAVRLPPTWKVLTSPGNEQWLYVLRGGSPKRELVDAIINGLVEQALLPQDEKDPGMKGVTRVARVPGFINGKAKYGGAFRVEWTQRTGPTYTLEEIRRGFNLVIHEYRQQVNYVKPNDDSVRERVELFRMYWRTAKEFGLRNNTSKNLGMWEPVRCPWEHEHSSSKTGADLRHPAPENEFYGAFKCHHGHCEGRGWREFTDHLDRLIENDLAAANARAIEFIGEDLDRRTAQRAARDAAGGSETAGS